jgi:uncharacterized iron-regulated membrane protein
MTATSSYPNRPIRTEEQAKADELRRVLAFAQRHDWGRDAWIEWEEGAVLFRSHWIDPATGEEGSDIEAARTMNEIRQIAGY